MEHFFPHFFRRYLKAFWLDNLWTTKIFVFLVSSIYFKLCQGASSSNRYDSGVGIITGVVIVQNYYYYYYYVTPLPRLLTIMYLKQTMFLWYVMSQVFCGYSLWHVMLFRTMNAVYLLHLYFSHYCCFLWLRQVVLSRYVAQVFSERFWDGSTFASVFTVITFVFTL